jgi:uncharacterized membrane protein YbhN (UPF0104 family)
MKQRKVLDDQTGRMDAGGLGIVELALVAGLVIFGTPVAVALPAVYLYRLITFWIPVPAGLGAYRALVRSGRL